MDSNGIILLMIAICIALILLMIMAKPIKIFLKFAVNAVAGVAGLILINFVLKPLGIYVGINFLTASFIGVLGIPGFGALMLISVIL